MFWRGVLHFLVVIFMTIISQTGGVVYLLVLLIFKWKNQLSKKWFVPVFVSFYVLHVFIVIPPLAKQFGRVALPWSHDVVKPRNYLYPMLNRHYVKPELKTAFMNAGSKMQRFYPNYKINYLDANFPFWDGFRLLPHLSHKDGKKLDVCFIYTYNDELIKNTKTWMGYGSCEEPRSNETNMPNKCSKHPQYGLLCELSDTNEKYKFYEKANKRLVQCFLEEPSIRKMFIEPHLKERMGLSNAKIRFHGCQAVRHDDHIHVQL